MSKPADQILAKCFRVCHANECVDPHINSRGCIAGRVAMRVMHSVGIQWVKYMKVNPWMRRLVLNYKLVFGHKHLDDADDIIDAVSDYMIFGGMMPNSVKATLRAKPSDVAAIAALEFAWPVACDGTKPQDAVKHAISLACFRLGFSRDETKAAIGFPIERRYHLWPKPEVVRMADRITSIVRLMKNGRLDEIYGQTTDAQDNAKRISRDSPAHYAVLQVPDLAAIRGADEYRRALEERIESRLGRAMANRVPVLAQSVEVADEPGELSANSKQAKVRL